MVCSSLLQLLGVYLYRFWYLNLHLLLLYVSILFVIHLICLFLLLSSYLLLSIFLQDLLHQKQAWIIWSRYSFKLIQTSFAIAGVPNNPNVQEKFLSLSFLSKRSLYGWFALILIIIFWGSTHLNSCLSASASILMWWVLDSISHFCKHLGKIVIVGLMLLRRNF